MRLPAFLHRRAWVTASAMARFGRGPGYARYHVLRACGHLDVRGANVLVAGCNTGDDCRFFVERGAGEVHGVDVIDEVGADFDHPAVTYHQMSVEELDFPDGSFDLTFSVATLEHVRGIEAAVSELVRVLHPGGVAYHLAAPLWNSSQGHHKPELFADLPWAHLRYPPDELVRWLEERGVGELDGASAEAHVAYMLDSRFFSMRAAQDYVRAAEALDGVDLIRNDLLPAGAEALTEEVADELAAKGYTREELLAETYWLIARRSA